MSSIYPPRLKLTYWFLGFLSLACTSVNLSPIVEEKIRSIIDDKTKVSGTICTGDSETVYLPHKILFLMDQSNSLDGTEGTDPTDPITRTNARKEAVTALVQLFADDPSFSFSFIKFATDVTPCPNTTQNPNLSHFTQNKTVIDGCISQFLTGEGVTSMYGAFEMAYLKILDDMEDMTPIERNRTTYEVILFTDGIPCEDNDSFFYPPFGIINLTKERKECIVQGLWSSPSPGSIFGDCPSQKGPVKLLKGLEDASEGGATIRIHTVLLSTFIKDQMALLPGSVPSLIPIDYARSLLTAISSLGDGKFFEVENRDLLKEAFLKLIQSPINPIQSIKSFLVTNSYVQNLPSGSMVDSDGDGFNDLEEMSRGLNPASPDTDGDGCSDKVEFQKNYNPAVKDCSCSTGTMDTDKDGLRDCEETLLGTAVEKVDTDVDGFTDFVEFWFGTNPLLSDADQDLDRDGMTNGEEILQHTSPIVPDGSDVSRYAYQYNFSNHRFESFQKECVDFEVSNISLGITKALETGQPKGRNLLEVLISNLPVDMPESEGTWKTIELEADFLGDAYKKPLEGFTLSEDLEVL